MTGFGKKRQSMYMPYLSEQEIEDIRTVIEAAIGRLPLADDLRSRAGDIREKLGAVLETDSDYFAEHRTGKGKG